LNVQEYDPEIGFREQGGRGKPYTLRRAGDDDSFHIESPSKLRPCRIRADRQGAVVYRRRNVDPEPRRRADERKSVR